MNYKHMEDKIYLVPEPKSIKFTGRWLQFDGFSNFREEIREEFNIKKGSWEFRHIYDSVQSIKVYEKKVETHGDINIATATAIQLIMQRKGFLPEVEVIEQLDFSFRGFHLDIARGGVPSLETFKKFMDLLFVMKYNKFGIYFEDLYPWKSFPEIGKRRGRITEEEWKEILKHGNKIGLDVFPSLELLGHMEHFLEMDKYRELGELWWTERDDCVDVTNQKASKFTKDLLKDAIETSPSKLIHIGGDETWSLGRGRSLDKTEKFQGPDLYIKHYRELVNLTSNMGKKAMMWGDMLTGMYLSSEEKKYWSKVVEDKIWDNVMIANWDYEPLSVDHFRRRISEIGHIDQQIACPALNSSATFYPDFEPALKNITSFLKAAKEEKLQGYMITAWGDLGQECLFSLLNPLVMASADIFSDPKEFPKKFSILSGEDIECSKARFEAGKLNCAPMIRNVLYRNLNFVSERRELRTGWYEAMRSFVNKYSGAKLSEDMNAILLLMKQCINMENREFKGQEFGSAIRKYEELWLRERKIYGLSNVVSKLLGSCEMESILNNTSK